jgi:hypothetical protein
MSKNSALQNYDCLKSYIQVLENKRKRSPRPNKKKERDLLNYHPALKYNEDNI